jgi:antitoxin (DNA-binding transcriptional repressor) of toxin-antitoxin stability system
MSQHGPVKVKSAELKAKLPQYLRRLRETGEPIEVLLRDEPVAYLTPIGNQSKLLAPAEAAELHELKNAFADVGLTLSLEDGHVGALPKLTTPVTAGDGRDDIVTVESMRSEKDW